MRSTLPDWATDAVHTFIDIHFDWKDRLKILLGWRVTVAVKTPTQHAVGRAESETTVSVWRPRQPGPGMMTLPDDEAPRPMTGERGGDE